MAIPKPPFFYDPMKPAAGNRLTIFTDPSSEYYQGGNASGTPASSTVPGSTVPLPVRSGGTPGSALAGRNTQAVRSAATTGADTAIALAEQLNPFMADTFFSNMEKVDPAFRERFAQMSANTEAELRGEIPSDVADMIRMISAEQGQSGALANTARNLGLTSLDQANRGFEHGRALFDTVKNYMTPDTVNVEAAAADVRKDLTALNTMTTAQAESLGLDRARLQQDLFKFKSEMDWTRELSKMNQAYQRFRDDENRRMFDEAQAARRTEEEVKREAYDRFLGILGQQKQIGDTVTSTPSTTRPSPVFRDSELPTLKMPSSRDVDLYFNIKG